MSIEIPDTDLIFLIPINLGKKIKDVSKKFEELKRKGVIKEYEIPIDVDKLNKTSNEFPELKLMYEADLDYFDISYLQLRRFGRALVDFVEITIPTRKGEQKVQAKMFITIFEVGIGILAFWLPNLRYMYKEDIIDTYFIQYKEIITDKGERTTLLEYIKQFIENSFGKKAVGKEQELLKDMFTMIFVKGMSSPNRKLPDVFIEEYEDFIFDLLTFPERYYPRDPEKRKSVESYTYYNSRTKEYVKEALHNISVRNDFPVFVSNNRFLGIKIHTTTRDYWTEAAIHPLTKRIIFNLILYSNAVLQMKLLRIINDTLSTIIKEPRKSSLNELVKMREDVFRDLEEYINTSIQRYEVWRKAMQDAIRELNIPDLYNAVKERLDMLNSFIVAEHQRSSERLFFLLNTLLIITSTISLIEAFIYGASLHIKAVMVTLALILWFAITYRYMKKYIL